MINKTSNRFSPEVRQQAVLVLDHGGDHLEWCSTLRRVRYHVPDVKVLVKGEPSAPAVIPESLSTRLWESQAIRSGRKPL